MSCNNKTEDNLIDFDYTVKLNCSLQTGSKFYETSITTHYNFINEFIRLKQYYLNSNTRKVLTEKSKYDEE